MLALLLQDRGLRTAMLSLDDLYLTLAERRRLADDVHPLLLTRGVPGTHDVALGLAVIDSLGRAGETAVPRFDKARDDRRDRAHWDVVAGPVEVILFEGWCVGARPQAEAALLRPVNPLERTRDPGRDLAAIRQRRAGGPLSEVVRPDRLPGRCCVLPASTPCSAGGWSRNTSCANASRTPARAMPRSRVFIQHYERLTRWIDAEMPERADAVAQLGADREVLNLTLAQRPEAPDPKPAPSRKATSSEPRRVRRRRRRR